MANPSFSPLLQELIFTVNEVTVLIIHGFTPFKKQHPKMKSFKIIEIQASEATQKKSF